MNLFIVACLGLMLAAGGKAAMDNDLSSRPFSPHDNGDVRQPPSGLKLKGICRKGCGEWQFEVIMDSQGRYYYRKEWSGDKDKGYRTITLIIDDFHGVSGESWCMGGRRGGGNAGPHGGKDAPEVCRRIWSAQGRLRQENGHYLEEFEQLAERQGLNIPRIIRWTNKISSMPEKTTVYTVRQIDLLDRFDTDFFDRMLKKHFSWAKEDFPKKGPANDQKPQ